MKSKYTKHLTTKITMLINKIDYHQLTHRPYQLNRFLAAREHYYRKPFGSKLLCLAMCCMSSTWTADLNGFKRFVRDATNDCGKKLSESLQQTESRKSRKRDRIRRIGSENFCT
mmetsp:Transcript_49889/g.97853  ORF Transcript_49889/g.97853 Transcript_49889/m.97853 type:complete len:114 (+) Transcript_49889:964-1305(+)